MDVPLKAHKTFQNNMTKLIEAMFERSKACSELFEDQPTSKENYIEETVCDQQSSDNLTEEIPNRKELLTRRKLSCPSLARFRGAEEDDEYENYASNLYFVKERSVESDDGTTAAESVVDTLDKLHDINETVSKKTLSSRNKSSRRQRTGYEGPAHLLVGGSSQFFKDFRRDEVYRTKMRDLIEKRVMTNTRYANSK